MNLTVLRTYAFQLEEIAKLELSELSQTLRQTVERMTTLDSQAREDADRYLLQVREGTTVDQAYAQLDAMDQAIAARKGLEQAHAAQQLQWSNKREALLEAMQYRKKLDLLSTRAIQKQRRHQEQQDQQLLDERAWRRSPSKLGNGA